MLVHRSAKGMQRAPLPLAKWRLEAQLPDFHCLAASLSQHVHSQFNEDWMGELD